MSLEYKSKGIVFQSLCPFYVVTKLSNMPKSFSSVTPDTYAAAAIKTLGSQKITNGCIIHNIQVI